VVCQSWVPNFAELGYAFLVRCGSRILRGVGREKSRGCAAFRWLRLDRARLGGGCERLYVPELGQERVLIVVAAT
jgi:hypothetical protein